MSAMFELCRLRCEYGELHAPLSFRLDDIIVYCNYCLVCAVIYYFGNAYFTFHTFLIVQSCDVMCHRQ